MEIGLHVKASIFNVHPRNFFELHGQLKRRISICVGLSTVVRINSWQHYYVQVLVVYYQLPQILI